MTEEIKKTLEKSVRLLKQRRDLESKEVKQAIVSIEKLIKRRAKKKVRNA
jgi:hypothetical protein